MNRSVARLLTRIYPRRWRERYGEGFEDLLAEGRGDLRACVDVVKAAVGEHIHPTLEAIEPGAVESGGMMSEMRTSFGTVVRQPSALVPLGMAVTALAVVMIHIAVYGAAREADEGPTAHIFQLLMVAQFPALLVVAILAAMVPVFIFHL